MCQKIHVTKTENKPEWVIRKGLKGRPTQSFRVKSDAVKAATILGHNNGGFVVIHKTDGQIGEVRHYRSAENPRKIRIQSAPVKGGLSRQKIYKTIATIELQHAG